MKKKLILIMVLLFFCNFMYAKAVNTESYTSGTAGTTSTSCTTGRCISSVGIKAGNYSFNNTAIFGVKVTIVNKNGDKIKGPINFWATDNMKQAVTGGIYLYNKDDGKIGGTNVYDANVGLNVEGLKQIDDSNYTYSDYITNLTENQVKAYLSHFYPDILSDDIDTVNSVISQIDKYYIKFQPMYVLMFRCSGNNNTTNCDDDIYIIGGTTKQILNFGFNTKKTWPKWYFKYIVRDKDTYNGTASKKWNVIKNYVLTTYITKSPTGSNIKAYGGNNCPTIDELKENTNERISEINQMVLNNRCNADSGLGVGYLKISDKVIKRDPCENDLKSASTPANYISVYEKYNNKTPSQNKNLILNFSNPKCEYSEYKLDSNESCLKISKKSSNPFTATNLSSYNDVIKYGNKKHYCLTEFELKSDIWKNNKTVIAGQFVVKNDVLATATLTKTCYIEKSLINGAIPTSINNENNDYVGDYVGDLYLNKKKMDSSTPKNHKLSFIYESTEGDFYKYVSNTQIEYYNPNVYARKIDGKIFSNKCSNCIDLGKGIITNFSDKNKVIKMDFYIENGENNIFDFSGTGTNTCTYNVKSELTTNNDLQIEFRIIDIKKPFNRNTNSNWCGEGTDPCNKNNTTVQTVIKERNNSYNSLNKEPIYSIELRPDDIKKIRKYNKDNKYNYYQMINVDDDLINSFVYDLKEGILRKYKENGSVEKTYGNLTHKLIVNKDS